MKSTNRFQLAPKRVISNRLATSQLTGNSKNTVGCGGSSGSVVTTLD